MTPTMKGGSEAKIGGHSRTGREGVQAGREMMGVVIVVSEDGTEVAIRRKEVIDGAIVLSADLLKGVMMAEPDVTEDSTKVATTSRGTIPGKPRADSGHFSGPHWPPEKTGSTAGKDRLLRQVG